MIELSSQLQVPDLKLKLLCLQVLSSTFGSSNSRQSRPQQFPPTAEAIPPQKSEDQR